MGLFSIKSDEERMHEEVGRFLLEGERVVETFGKRTNPVYMTNVRVVFRNISERAREEKKEIVMLPFGKIDAVHYVERSAATWGIRARVVSKGLIYDVGFDLGSEEECVKFCNQLNLAVMDSNFT